MRTGHGPSPPPLPNIVIVIVIIHTEDPDREGAFYIEDTSSRSYFSMLNSKFFYKFAIGRTRYRSQNPYITRLMY